MVKKFKILYWGHGDFALFLVEETDFGKVDRELGSPLLIASLLDCEEYVKLYGELV